MARRWQRASTLTSSALSPSLPFPVYRLWHQLTEELKALVLHPMFERGGLVELYEEFVADFADKSVGRSTSPGLWLAHTLLALP